jgi:hypothetical protein
VNPDRLAELEEERRFLLRSLDDLEREYAAGDVDEADYVTLRDGYTVRAAAVLRAIDEGKAALPTRRVRSWPRLVAVVAVVALIAVGLGWWVARSSGQRLPGQELSGGIPGDVSAQLTEARLVLGTDPLRAQELYNQVLEERPDHPEALTYSGWLLAINSLGASEEVRALALDTARASLARAIESDPSYADPHCLLAVIEANFSDDPAAAEPFVQACLDRNPPADMRGLIQELVPTATSTP